jgi:hypothetical protein
MMESFDMPDTHESCSRRNVTVSPAQSLEMLNSEQVAAWSRAFAERVLNDAGLTAEAQIDRAYRLAFSRAADAEEKRAGMEFLAKQTRLTGDAKTAFADFCHVLLNTNEFVYVN